MKKILIVEDNKSILEELSIMLVLEDFQVLEAENGNDALKLADQESPDLIISDILMPGLDGFGFLAELRNNSKLSDLPFIFLTACSSKADFNKGKRLGANDFVCKPFDFNDLLSRIRKLLPGETIL